MVGIESMFTLSLSLLREVGKLSKNGLRDSLEFLYDSLQRAKHGSLFANDKLSFMIDRNLNEVRSFLVGVITDDKESDESLKELCLKILLRLGIMR